MKRIIFSIFLLSLFVVLKAQTRKELEEQRNKTLEEISFVDNMIKENEAKKTTGLNDIKVLGNKLQLRQNVIEGLKDEMSLIEGRIEINKLAITLMEDDLENIKKEYEKTIEMYFKA